MLAPQKLFGWLNRSRAQAPAAHRSHLLERERFHAILDRERKRSDRSGAAFSLVVFSPAVPEQVDQLVSFLEQRLRTTDEAGWFDETRIAALLPDTPQPQAWKVAESVRSLFHGRARPQCEVYIYPSHSLPSDGGRLGSKEVSPPTLESWGFADAGPQPHPRVQPLEAMFCRKLPAWKRALDVAGAVCGLILLSPLLLATAVAIKLTSRGPVLFTQMRSGLGGTPFKIYKFRTMCLEAESKKDELRSESEQDGPAFKLSNDPRMTRIGNYLRKTCIDELPQLWNVLKGDMTLVGPRPLPCNESEQCDGWKRRRLDVTPGLTCIWQVQGKSRVTFAEWMRMDIRYIESRSLWRDAKLVVQTIIAVVRHKGSG